LRLGLNMREHMGASTPAIDRLCAPCRARGDVEAPQGLSIRTINRLFMLTLPAHLQMNCGKLMDATHRDVLRAKIIRKALSQPS
jgi:hypothetical protein